MTEPTLNDYQRVVDLYEQLMPEAGSELREFILARTPADLQVLMTRLVDATMRVTGTTTLDEADLEGR